MIMTAQEIERLVEDNHKAIDHLMKALDQMPKINHEPCWLERIFVLEPTILLEKHKLD